MKLYGRKMIARKSKKKLFINRNSLLSTKSKRHKFKTLLNFNKMKTVKKKIIDLMIQFRILQTF